MSKNIYNIAGFKFTWKKDNKDSLQFNTPKEAINFFTSKGYGIHNWNIEIILQNTSNLMISRTPATLHMFNYLTDNWDNQDTVNLKLQYK